MTALHAGLFQPTIYNPTVGFVYILPNNELNQPIIFFKYTDSISIVHWANLRIMLKNVYF